MIESIEEFDDRVLRRGDEQFLRVLSLRDQAFLSMKFQAFLESTSAPHSSIVDVVEMFGGDGRATQYLTKRRHLDGLLFKPVTNS